MLSAERWTNGYVDEGVVQLQLGPGGYHVRQGILGSIHEHLGYLVLRPIAMHLHREACPPYLLHIHIHIGMCVYIYIES